MNIFEEIPNFPTTRYQGSKRKILPWIYECLNDLEFETVLDAFGGSGVVSYLLKKMGKSVTYNDFLYFNQIIGTSIIENQSILLNQADIESITNCVSKSSSFISDTFSGIYFLDEENVWIENTIRGIENLNNFYTGSELIYKKSIAYNALFQSCMIKRPYNLFHRKNLEMRTRNVNRSFGNKTSWDTLFSQHFNKFVKEINKSVFNSDTFCHSLNCDVFSLENLDYDLVYFDPPYINRGKSNESSDYLKCYHFLEGISRFESWSDIIDFSTINKRIKKDFLPNHFNRKQSLTTFEKLIEKFHNSIIVISYKYGGIPSIDELVDLLGRYKQNIRVHDKHYKYALNKQNGNAKLNREFILIGY